MSRSARRSVLTSDGVPKCPSSRESGESSSRRRMPAAIRNLWDHQRPRIPPAAAPRPPVAPVAPVQVRSQFPVQPRIEALAVRRGELLCTNDDIIRNSASNWSPMSAAQIAAKTGIESRCYTEGGLEHLALDAASSALDRAGRTPEEVGAVIFCTCTNTRLLPSAATWLSGQLGMFQTHTSVDLVAACAGFPYGLANAVRILQEVRRPILLVCAEKFSDKVAACARRA